MTNTITTLELTPTKKTRRVHPRQIYITTIIANKRDREIVKSYNKLTVAEAAKFNILMKRFEVSRETIYRALKKYPTVYNNRKEKMKNGRCLLSNLQKKQLDKFLEIIPTIPNKYIEAGRLCNTLGISLATYYKLKNM